METSINVLRIIIFTILISQLKCLTSVGSTTYEGVTRDQLPSYFIFNGNNAIKAPLDNRRDTTGIDYFIRAWIKPFNDFNQTGDNNTQVIFELEKTFKCQLQFINTLACMKINITTQDDFMSLSRLTTLTPMMWLHIAVAGSKSLKRSFLRADYSDEQLRQQNYTYLSMIQATTPWSVLIGGNNQILQGFKGAIREFLFTEEFVYPNQVQTIKNSYISWNLKQIGYYRLQKGDLKDESKGNMTASLVTQNPKFSLPSWQYDTIPNDICFQQEMLSQLPRLDNLTSEVASIDSRMLTYYPSIQYSASFWLRTKPGIANGTIYKDSLLVFQLQGVFGLWFSSSTQLRIMIFAKKSSYSVSSLPIIVPIDKWFNLQFTLDKSTGYEVRVYDQFRRQIFNISEKIKLQDQTPASKVNLFTNYRGYIKSIMIYQSKRALPIFQTIGENIESNETGLILYHKFDRVNLINSSLQSLAKTSKNVSGQAVKISGNITFDYVPWIESNDFNSTISALQQGSLNQTVNYFDGVSCTNQYIDYGFQGQQSWMQNQINQIKDDLYEGTLEFWFKRNIANQTAKNYLASIYSDKQQKEYFAMFIDSTKQNLNCLIFSDYSNYSLIINQVDQNSQGSEWQHICCKFQNLDHFAAIYQNQDNLKYIVGYNKQDVSNIQAKIPADQYSIIIGNNKDKVNGQSSALIKEVRFWKISREYYQIESSRWGQIDPSNNPGLISYYRLNSGNFNITNFNTLEFQASTFNKIEPLYNQSRYLNCPLNTYLLQNQISNCFRNPFKNLKINLFSQSYQKASQDDDSVQLTYIKWTLSTLHSDYQANFNYQYNFQNELKYSWLTSNVTLSQYLQSNQQTQLQNGVGALEITNEIFTDANNDSSKFYYIESQAYNKIKTFSEQEGQRIVLNQCRYLVDKDSQQSINKNTILIDQADDLNYNFWIINQTDCGDQQEQILFDLVRLEIFPSYITLQNISVSYSGDDDCFILNIPSSQISQIPTYQYITFLITVRFGQDNLQTLGSYLNIVYQIKIIDKIDIQFSDNIPTKLEVNESLTINFQVKYLFNDTQLQTQSDQLGIYSEWVCPDIFSNICSQFQNQYQLIVSSNDFNSSGGQLFFLYEFKVRARSQFDPYQDYWFDKSIQVRWQSFQAPDFELRIKDKDKIMVAEDNQIEIILNNYDASTGDLDIQWQIVPEVIQDYIQLDNYNTLLTIKQGGLQKLTDYNVIVIINNTNTDNAFASQTLEFTTGIGTLNEGQFQITPTSGYSNETIFNISISNWDSDYQPISYYIQGQQSQNSDIFNITDQILDSSQGYSNTLPTLITILITVFDSNQITITQQQSVNISPRPPPIDEETQLMQNRLEELSNLTKNISITSQNYTTANKTILDKKLQVLFNVSSITANFQQGIDDDDSQYNKIIVDKCILILKQATNNTIQLNHTLATLAFDILQQLQLKDQAMKQVMLLDDDKEGNFTQNYIQLISQLNKYAVEKIQFMMQGRRILYQNTMSLSDLKQFQANIRDQKQTFQDRYCQQMTQNLQQKVFDTSSFKLIFDSFIINATTLTQRLYQFNADVISNIRLDQLINISKQINNQSSTLCMQATQYYLSPFQGYSFSNQNPMPSAPYIQFESFDDQGNYLLLNNQVISSSQSTPLISTQFRYNYNNTNNQFKNNQTVCMQLKDDPDNFSQLNWNVGTCQTTYNVKTQFLICQCQGLSNGFYSIITDSNRIQIIDGSSTNTTFQNSNNKDDNYYDLDFSIMILIGFLSIILILVLILSLVLDKKDAKALGKSKIVTRELYSKIQEKSKQPLQSIMIREKQLEKYMRQRDLRCCSIFGVIFSPLHPLLTIFAFYDLHSRIYRASVLFLQISILGALELIHLRLYYEVDESSIEDDEKLTKTQITKFLIIGFAASIFFFPVPEFLINWMRIQIIPAPKQKKVAYQIAHEGGEEEEEFDSDKNDYGSKDHSLHIRQKKEPQIIIQGVSESSQLNSSSRKQGPQQNDFSQIPDNRIQDGIATKEDFKASDFNSLRRNQDAFDNVNSKRYIGQTDRSLNIPYSDRQLQYDNKMNSNSEIKVIDSCKGCKIIFVIFSILFYIAFVVLLAFYCMQIPISYQRELAITFGIAILTGWIILNPLKILLVAAVLKSVVLNERKQVKDKNCCLQFLAFFLVDQDARLMMMDMLTVQRYKNKPATSKTQQELNIKANLNTQQHFDTIFDSRVPKNNNRQRFQEQPVKSSALMTFEAQDKNNNLGINDQNLQNSHSRAQSDGPLNDIIQEFDIDRLASIESLSLTEQEIITSNRFNDTKKKTAIPEQILVFDHKQLEDVIQQSAKKNYHPSMSINTNQPTGINMISQQQTIRQPSSQTRREKNWAEQLYSPQAKPYYNNEEDKQIYDGFGFDEAEEEDGNTLQYFQDVQSSQKLRRKPNQNQDLINTTDKQKSLNGPIQLQENKNDKIKISLDQDSNSIRSEQIPNPFALNPGEEDYRMSLQQQLKNSNKMNFENEPEISESNEYFSEYVQNSAVKQGSQIEHRQSELQIDLLSQKNQTHKFGEKPGTLKMSSHGIDQIDQISDENNEDEDDGF